jgi:hypothetical protein
MTAALDLQTATIAEIAGAIENDWQNIYFGARPYLDAMHTMQSINDAYGLDDGKGIIIYFLSNARGWRGETAKAIKAELKSRYYEAGR